jgi:hypothetical protein
VRRNVAQQALTLTHGHSGSNVRVRASNLTWEGRLRPTDVSAEYRVRITYKMNYSPIAWVLDELASRPDDVIPHRYGDGSLCLHRQGEWNPGMLIVDTTVVWMCEWLFFYELWLANGDWHGSGEWPPKRELPWTRDGDSLRAAG